MIKKLLLVLVSLTAGLCVNAQPFLVNTDGLQATIWDTFHVTTLTAANISGTTTAATVSATTINAGTVVVTNSLSIAGGTTVSKLLYSTSTVDIGATATNAISTANITLAGAGTNGAVFLSIVAPDTHFMYNAVISATNTVTIRATNISTTDAVNPAATAMNIFVLQP